MWCVQTLTGEEVDTRDSYKLMLRLTARREWDHPDARSLPFSELRKAKVLHAPTYTHA